MLSAVGAMLIANSTYFSAYDSVLSAQFSVLINGDGLSKPMILWINDGLMAIFFFLVGLELKREVLEGKLKNPADVVLPGLAAVGGMAMPAALYLMFNWNTPETISGWAIPAATDIAFALGVLALVGVTRPKFTKGLFVDPCDFGRSRRDHHHCLVLHINLKIRLFDLRSGAAGNNDLAEPAWATSHGPNDRSGRNTMGFGSEIRCTCNPCRRHNSPLYPAHR